MGSCLARWREHGRPGSGGGHGAWEAEGRRWREAALRLEGMGELGLLGCRVRPESLSIKQVPHGWTISMEWETQPSRRESRGPGRGGSGTGLSQAGKADGGWCEHQGRQGFQVKREGDAFRRLWISARNGGKDWSDRTEDPSRPRRWRWVPGTEIGGGKAGEVIRDVWGDPGAESRQRKSRHRAGTGAGQRVEGQGSRASLTKSSEAVQERGRPWGLVEVGT